MEHGNRVILVIGATFKGSPPAARSEAGDWRFLECATVESADEILAGNKSIRVALGVWDDSGCATSAQQFTELRNRHRFLQLLALVPRGSLDDPSVASCIAYNFFDYLTTPVDGTRLSAMAGHAYGMSLVSETAFRQVDDHEDEQMVGRCSAMRQLFRDIRKVACSHAPAFIHGESGTGKELAASAIHERSPRANGPFVAVDCAAIPSNLIQSELFGYEKGAFTGAGQRKGGRIEAAQGGTLFLDEIGDLPLDLQGNLLRFLQESTIQRVGGTHPISVDVRVIAATHVDLEKAVIQGAFRQDLYYRLNVLRLQMPPLREREGDIEILARYFLDQFMKDAGKHIRGFTAPALAALREHQWPGNIRELINRVRRAVVMCDAPWISPRDLDFNGVKAQPELVQLEAARQQAERNAIHHAIRSCRSNYSAAARMLGVSRVTLYRLIDKHRMSGSPAMTEHLGR